MIRLNYLIDTVEREAAAAREIECHSTAELAERDRLDVSAQVRGPRLDVLASNDARRPSVWMSNVNRLGKARSSQVR